MAEVKVTNKSPGRKAVHTAQGEMRYVNPGETVTFNLSDEAIAQIKNHAVYRAWHDLGELVFEGLDFDSPMPDPVVEVKVAEGEGEGEGDTSGEGDGEEMQNPEGEGGGETTEETTSTGKRRR